MAVENLYHSAGFNDQAKFGLLEHLCLDHKDLSRFLMFHNPLHYAKLLNWIKRVAFAKDKLSPSSSTEAPRMVCRRLDVETRKLETRVDDLGKRLSELALLIQKGKKIPLE